MRFISFDVSASQRVLQTKLEQRISGFWNKLSENSDPTLRTVADALQQIDSGLSVESCRRGTSLVLRSDDRGLRPCLAHLLSCAPETLKSRFVALRPRYDFEIAERAAKTWGVDLSRARVRAGFSRGHLIDIVVYVPGGKGTDDEREAALDAVEALLGEFDFEDWIGEVNAVAAPHVGALRVLGSNSDFERAFSLRELPEAFETAIAALYASLPERPLWSVASDDQWTMFELEPEPADDFAGQDDLTYTVTRLPELRKSFLRADAFASRRFSRHGEVFGYLKIDARGASANVELEKRRVLEEALDAGLIREQAGTVIGSGLGLRYSYIDLCLSDPERAIALIRNTAQAHHVAQRSWLLFCDSDYARQWVPVWDTSCAPPGVVPG